jgi:hypothetical protein
MHVGAGNVKRVLEIFRGVRNLTISNGAAYEALPNRKARRTKKDKQSDQRNKVFEYSAVVDHRDKTSKREYRVLWADGSLTWEQAEPFLDDVQQAEGKCNVVTKYLEQLPAEAGARGLRTRRVQNTLSSADSWPYKAVIGHRNDISGARSEYHVAWLDGSFTWEPVSRFLPDVEQCEGKGANVITEYETQIKKVRTLAQTPSIQTSSIEQAKRLATWVEQTETLEMTSANRVRADERLATAPRVPSLLPWSVRSPLTSSAGRMKMHDYLLYARHWAPLHLRGFFKENVAAILISYFQLISRMTDRVIRMQEVTQLRSDVGEVLSQLELILPATEFTILVHVLVHIPDQLAWFGPAHTTWMFGFERWV